MTLVEISVVVRHSVKNFTKRSISDDTNLFSESVGLAAHDMLCIISGIEDSLHHPITDIFITNDSGIMTIKNISQAIFNTYDMQ